VHLGEDLPLAESRDHPFREPKRLLSVRVAREDKLVGAHRMILGNPVCHLGKTADQGRARATAEEAHTRPDVRIDLQVGKRSKGSRLNLQY
jgi:hypothetical protein